MRVLIVHDWIVGWAGSERVVEQLLEIFPQAHLVVGLLGKDCRGLNAVTRRAKERWLAHVPMARAHHRWFLPLFPAAFATLDASSYDLVISSAHAFAKMVRTGPVPHLCYCHSPPRYLWDRQADYRRARTAAGTALALATPVLRALDRASAARVDAFVANSRYIAGRIRRCYGREARVVHPPVAAKPTVRRYTNREETLLSLGRLVPYKRVDLAIAAANAARFPLLIAGDGPERARLERLAGPTVTFAGAVDEATAGDLMERCTALVFCAEEDFGITPLEANAHGLPVIGLRRGGLVETMRDGLTAEFFDEPEVDAVREAMGRALHRPWNDGVLRANAARFSAAHFRSGILDEVRLLMATPRRRHTSRAIR